MSQCRGSACEEGLDKGEKVREAELKVSQRKKPRTANKKRRIDLEAVNEL